MRLVLSLLAIASQAIGLFGPWKLYIIRETVDKLSGTVRVLSDITIFQTNLYIFSAFTGLFGLGLGYFAAFIANGTPNKIISFSVIASMLLYFGALITLFGVHYMGNQ